jgi:flagellar biosynthetic protein FliO
MKTALCRGKRSLRPILVIIGLLLLGNSTFLVAAKPEKIAMGGGKVAQGADSSIENKAFPADKAPKTTTQAGKSSGIFSTPNFGTIWTALAFVLALILIGAWLVRKAYPGSSLLFGSLPVLQVLGRTHLGAKQALVLVKLDNKLILLGLTDHQINPVLTIDDPEEVSRLLTFIEQARPTGITSGFRQFFSRESSEIQHQQEAATDNSLNFLYKNKENDVLQLKNEINLLINKVEKIKGIGGQNISG